jgi:hypothetical protein
MASVGYPEKVEERYQAMHLSTWGGRLIFVREIALLFIRDRRGRVRPWYTSVVGRKPTSQN